MNPRQRHDSLADLIGSPTLPAESPSEMAALHRRLVAEADRAGLLDIAYRTVDTPVGTLLLAATSAGLLRVAYQREDLEKVLAELAAKVSPRMLEAPGRLEGSVRQLEEYFAGRRRRFDLPLDLSLSSGFRRRVLSYLPDIAYGRTASYQVVASAVDNPRAVRAVGSACATNPLPLVIPCHRVIRSDGLIGSYLGGTETKRHLLELEGAV